MSTHAARQDLGPLEGSRETAREITGYWWLSLIALEGAGVSAAWRWVAGLFAFLSLVSSVICFISPEGTFAALADSLGFLFLLIGLWWMGWAFEVRRLHEQP